MTEDIALMRVLPNMTVVVPCDSIETKKATIAAAKTKKPIYLRFAREKTPVFTTKKTPFKIGKAVTLRNGDDLTIIGAGPLLYDVLVAAEVLSEEMNIEARVINMHTIKPLDTKIIAKAAKETGAIVTVEEAQVVGGLGGAVSEALCAMTPVPVERIGMQDEFGTSGDSEHVLTAMGLSASDIALAAIRVLKRKNGEEVTAIPVRITSALKRREKMSCELNEEALARTPKKWGGKKADKSLKSRK
jgi:transketolase